MRLSQRWDATKMKLRLPAFGLRFRILGIALLGILGVGTVAATYLVGDSRLAQLSVETERADTIHDLARATERDLLLARRAEKDFLLRSDDSYVGRNESAARDAQAHIDRMTAILGDLRQPADPTEAGLAEALSGSRSAIATYAASFGRVVALQRTIGLDETKGLLGSLRTSVHDAEADITRLDLLQLNVLMLTLRRHEKDFLARGAPEYGKSFKQVAQQFADALDKAQTLNSTARAHISAQMASYEHDFLALMAARLELAQETKVTVGCLRNGRADPSRSSGAPPAKLRGNSRCVRSDPQRNSDNNLAGACGRISCRCNRWLVAQSCHLRPARLDDRHYEATRRRRHRSDDRRRGP